MTAALPRLHAVTDDRVIADGQLAERAALMAQAAGPALAVHVRSVMLEGGAFLELARELGRTIQPHGSWLVVNGRADVARVVNARAVVSGRGGLAVADLRRVAPQALAARSVHDDAQARAAAADGADFLMMSSSVPPSTFQLPPSILIGGMTPERTAGAVKAGAWGVAAIRALWDADDPAAAASAFLAVLPGEQTVGLTINGESRRARAGISLAQLLTDLGLDARAVVVEHNHGIVRREALAGSALAEGDIVELVHFVGGG